MLYAEAIPFGVHDYMQTWNSIVDYDLTIYKYISRSHDVDDDSRTTCSFLPRVIYNQMGE